MPSYQKVYYCKNCKTNVGLNTQGHCKKCNSNNISTSWSVRFRIMCLDGEKQKRLSGFDSKKKAEAEYIKFQKSYVPYSEAKNKNSFIIEDLIKKYLMHCKIENADSTLYEKDRTFNLFILPYFKNKDISTINKSDLQEWQNLIWTMKNPKTKTEYAWKYKCKIRDTLFNFLSYCEEFYDIPNKFRLIKRPKNKEMKKEITFWEIDEFNKFISTIEEELWKTLWLTFMFTGARFNEIRALYFDDIGDVTKINKSLIGKKMKYSSTTDLVKPTKNYKVVTKKTPEILKKVIENYKNNNPSNKFLFGNEKPLAENTIRRQLNLDIQNYNNTHKENTLKRITPHGFRHSYASMLIHYGVTTKIIAELIGDTEEQVIKTYGHLYKDAKINAINLINQNVKI